MYSWVILPQTTPTTPERPPHMPTTRQIREQMRTNVEQRSLDELLAALDDIHRNTSTSPADPGEQIRDKIIIDVAHTKMTTHANSLTSRQICDDLTKAMTDRIRHGAHAAPSWGVRVGILVDVLRRRHPEANTAITTWEQGRDPNHDNPIEPAVKAVRTALEATS